MNRILVILVVLAFTSLCQAQNKRVKQIDCYFNDGSTKPNKEYHFVYDSSDRLVRVYDDENYSRYQQELVFEYDDNNSTITIKGLMPGYKDEHDDKGTAILTVENGRIISMLSIYDDEDGPEEYLANLSYNSQGEWTGIQMYGEELQQNMWNNGNMVMMLSDGEVCEVTSYTDINYPASFPFYYVPGMEYDCFAMPSALYHFGSLFGKRQQKLPATAKVTYDDYHVAVLNYSYQLDSEGNIAEIVQTWQLGETSDYEKLVFHYEDSPSSIRSVNIGGMNKNASYYDLSGRHLKLPQRGINIINGKKLVVK